jgi:thiamine biosynthesis lipoprotein
LNTLLTTAAGLFVSLSLGGGVDHVVVHRRVEMMGTVLWMELEVQERAEGLCASEEALRTVEAAEARLSTWTTESELARFLTAKEGELVELTPLLAEELRKAKDLCEETRGAFDPSVGALTQAWGLRSGGSTPSEAMLERARAACGSEHWLLQGNVAVRSSTDLVIDEGGFGKGAALDQAISCLERAGVPGASLNLGGQLAFLGRDDRVVPIADPEHRAQSLMEITVRGGSVATSGTAERGAHIIDPRTGRPAKDFGSVTVWAGTALEADALSTALFVLGPVEGLALAEEMEDVEAVFIEKSTPGRKVSMTSGLRKRTRPLKSRATQNP